MTNSIFYLYDTEDGSCLKIKGYEEYLKYYKIALLPKGLGTRYIDSEITRVKQVYHYRIVKEDSHEKRTVR